MKQQSRLHPSDMMGWQQANVVVDAEQQLFYMHQIQWHILSIPIKIVIIVLLLSAGLALLIVLLILATLVLFVMSGMEIVFWIVTMESCQFCCLSMCLCPIVVLVGGCYQCFEGRYYQNGQMWGKGFQYLYRIITNVMLYGCGYQDEEDSQQLDTLPEDFHFPEPHFHQQLMNQYSMRRVQDEAMIEIL